MKLLTELTINGEVVRKFQDSLFLGCEVYEVVRNTDSEDARELYFVKNKEVKGKLSISANAECSQNEAFVTGIDLSFDKN